MYPEIVKNIQGLLKIHEIVVVAISGHGGSGKSTLADRLAKQFGVKDDQIVRMDALHAKNYEHEKNIYMQHEWGVLEGLLARVRATDRMQYQCRDWKGFESMIDVSRPKIVIVEGGRLIRPELLHYFDISIWIDCPLDFATKRAIERNRQQGDSEEEINLWYTKWVPEARQYVEDAQPQKIADFVFTEYRSEA